MHYVNLILLLSCSLVALKCLLDGIHKVLIAKWLGEKLYGARFYGPHTRRNVAVGRYENDRNLHARLDQPALDLESAHSGKAKIQNEAARHRRHLSLQEILRGRKQLCV